ncbi:hydrolase [Enterovibrio sp. ZSDZ42]|uniref:Hydrolase n=1 Tax=Enterovibrio gelatinilyticus TaxID=2899819 RepID=A0ABT5R6L3_9GAMM|nr:hydrolase [Enterovibrio sp. ZSDZ42]MDD1795903.1 hydrolase [Enterovibrio sp. ZSDZ42]
MKETFVPMKWGSNPHVQTLLPRFVRRKAVFEPVWQRIDTPDKDFLDICWTEDPEQAHGKPVVVLFHGLAGCFYSPYANGLLNAFKQQGWLGVMMHFRGCSGLINRQARSYHSGETSDARLMLEYIQQRFPDVPRLATGVSLGGNMLVRYLAEFNHDPLIKAGCVISPPLDLGACSSRIQQGFSKVYQAYLLRSMNRTLTNKLQRHPKIGHWTSGQKVKISTLYQFDETVTAPLNAFDSAEDYYQRCSGLSVLQDIATPLKVIHAKDDPFMTQAVIPTVPLPENIDYHLTQYGGHVGFVSGTLKKPEFWLEKEVPRWLALHIK